MEIKELETRITKKQADIEKTLRSINKFITKNGFSEEDIEFAKNNGWTARRKYAEEKWPRDYYKLTDFDDLGSRYSTLKDQNLTLQKYQNQLVLQKAKEDKENNTVKIPVIVEYLKGLKQQWIRKIKADIKFFEENVLAKYDEYQKLGWNYLWDHKQIDDYDRAAELKAYREYREAEKKYVKQLDPAVTRYYLWNSTTRSFNWEQCEKELDKDINNLYWDLVNRVTEVVGEIVDATSLSIGAKGNLNGVITGTEGKAYVETIPAGGYNIQRFHYRTLVKPIKGGNQ